MLALSLLLLMAYPYQVDPGNILRLSTVSTRNRGPGIIGYGGNYYSVYSDRVDGTIEVWRSTDRGITWQEMDAANHKQAYMVGVDSDGQPYAWAEDTSGAIDKRIWVVWVAGVAFNTHIVFAAFDLTTGLWGATTTGGPDSADYFEMHMAMQIPNVGTPIPFVFCEGPREVVGSDLFWRSYYFPLPISTGIWDAPQRVNGAAGEAKGYLMQGATRGADGNMVVYTYSVQGSGDPPGNTMQARVIGVSGVMGNWFTFFTGTNPSTDSLFGTPFTSANGSTIAFPYTRPSGGNTVFYLATAANAASLNPIWTQELVTTVSSTPQTNVAGAFIGSDPIIMWGDYVTTQSRSWFYVRKRSGAWGGAVQLYQANNPPAAFIRIVSMYPVSGGVGAVFDFGETPAFSPHTPWYWELRTAGNLNSILGAMRSAKVTP